MFPTPNMEITSGESRPKHDSYYNRKIPTLQLASMLSKFSLPKPIPQKERVVCNNYHIFYLRR